MKFRFEETTEREEIVAYAQKRNELIDSIENLCLHSTNLIGCINGRIKELNPAVIECFITLSDKVYALSKKEKYQIKRRLYELKELYKEMFIYINQGCLANINLIDHFEASIGGSLLVVFKSGYKDYVSRRQIKNVKERLGIKNEKNN